MERWAGTAALAVALLLAACRGEAPIGPSEGEWSTYVGAWFEIDHPADYGVRASLTSVTAEGYDSVFFDSPDGEVSLYVCSPQWSRDCSDIVVDIETETPIDSVEREIADGRVLRRRIAARDGSYERLYEETALYDGAVRWIVGVRYGEGRDLEQLTPLFERFAGSLRQFAD